MQRHHRHLRPVEQPEGGTGVPQPPGDEQRGAVRLIQPRRVGGEELEVMGEQPVREGRADDAPLRHKSRDEIRVRHVEGRRDEAIRAKSDEKAKQDAVELASDTENKKAAMRARADARMDKAAALIVERVVNG